MRLNYIKYYFFYDQKIVRRVVTAPVGDVTHPMMCTLMISTVTMTAFVIILAIQQLMITDGLCYLRRDVLQPGVLLELFLTVLQHLINRVYIIVL